MKYLIMLEFVDVKQLIEIGKINVFMKINW